MSYVSFPHSSSHVTAPAHSDFFEEAFNYIAYKGKFRGEVAAESLLLTLTILNLRIDGACDRRLHPHAKRGRARGTIFFYHSEFLPTLFS
jgi:hypothetical protein